MQPWLERSTEKLTTGPLNSPPLPLPWTRSTLKKLLKPQLKPTNSSWKQAAQVEAVEIEIAEF
jgi:hypothetical protein